jgi:2-dehydro-3-deoxyphosphooctonate aldolase (KDO 8-P synthase)
MKIMGAKVSVGDITIGKGEPLALMAGPCVIESAKSVMSEARKLKDIADRMGVPLIFKASFDKANRSSVRSFRGPGIKEGLKILKGVKEELMIPVLSDIHSVEQVAPAAKVLDVIQIPAFLCRQTDLVVEAGRTGKVINVKKGQFMSPEEMKNVIDKIEFSGNRNILLTERGSTFGYNMLVNDFRGVVKMAEYGYPVVYDATHSVQLPGGKGTASGGESRYILPLSRAAVAIGCDALFLEIHTDPFKAKSDGPNMLKISDLEGFLEEIKKIEKAVRPV